MPESFDEDDDNEPIDIMTSDASPPSTPTLKPNLLANTIFFKKTPADNKKNFKANIAEAKELIANNPSEIAKQVFDLISNGKIQINSFYELTYSHFKSIKDDYPSIKLTHSYKNVAKIEGHLDGIYFRKDYKIYISSQLSIQKMAKTIIHEFSHHINYSKLLTDLKTHSRKRASLMHEIDSFSAEKYFKKNGCPLTELEKNKIEEKVKNLYPEFLEVSTNPSI